MVWIDIVLLVIVLWFAYKGFRNGLIIELTTFIALLLAIWAALKYGNIVTGLLERNFSLQGNYLPFLSFVITFILVLVVISFIGRIITKALQVAQLGILNRLLGFLFGIFKVGILLALFVNGLDRLNRYSRFISQETINDSYLYQPLNGFAEKIYKFSNEHFDEVKEQFDKTIETLDSTEV